MILDDVLADEVREALSHEHAEPRGEDVGHTIAADRVTADDGGRP